MLELIVASTIIAATTAGGAHLVLREKVRFRGENSARKKKKKKQKTEPSK